MLVVLSIFTTLAANDCGSTSKGEKEVQQEGCKVVLPTIEKTTASGRGTTRAEPKQTHAPSQQQQK